MAEATANPLEVMIEDEDDRYHRQSLISWWDQDRLRDASVLVVGAGALGNELVKNLALMGVGRILVSDLDRIENSNLARCVFFRPEDEGRTKADTLADRASALNPDVEVIPIAGDIRLAVGLGIFNDVDVVLGGLDNREARLFVNQACWKTTTPWIDGAIEGLMGVVRVFDPPDSACYECTMNERDHELIAARRTCALLTREEMDAGKVPTTATSASVVAGIQVQEAVKVLHSERLGASSLRGGGFHFVGLTHDSYRVTYGRRDDCLSHDTYDLENAETVDPETPLGVLLERATQILGPNTVLEFEHEIALGATCGECGESTELLRPVIALDSGSGVCPGCGNPWQLSFIHNIETGSPFLDRRARDLGLPPADVLTARSGFDRRFFLLGDEIAGAA